MSHEIEIEFKNLLTLDEFSMLRKEFGLKKENFVTQHNDYFDTPGFDLKAQGSALRIRQKQDKFVLTLKQPDKVGLLETHQHLNAGQAETLLNGGEIPEGDVLKALGQFKLSANEFKHLGRLTTKRAEFSYHGGILVLDHSFYGLTEDYELEYETNNYDVGKSIFFKLLNDFGIPKRPTENKIKRLMNAIS